VTGKKAVYSLVLKPRERGFMSQGTSIARVSVGEANEATAQHRLGAPEPTGAAAAMHRRQLRLGMG
jgi:hypothetical protein